MRGTTLGPSRTTTGSGYPSLRTTFLASSAVFPPESAAALPLPLLAPAADDARAEASLWAGAEDEARRWECFVEEKPGAAEDDMRSAGAVFPVAEGDDGEEAERARGTGRRNAAERFG